jgi:putative oxidoreductase
METTMTLSYALTTTTARLDRLAGRLAFLAPLATRLVIGLGFVHTGLGKWRHLDRTVEFFAGLGIPFPAASATLVASLELVGGAALLAGLLTRVFATALSGTMAVALLTADRPAFLAAWGGAGETSLTDVTAFVYLLFLLWLALLGPGAASLDRALRRRGTGSGAAVTTPRPPA